jgi:hypothetical protein
MRLCSPSAPTARKNLFSRRYQAGKAILQSKKAARVYRLYLVIEGLEYSAYTGLI